MNIQKFKFEIWMFFSWVRWCIVFKECVPYSVGHVSNRKLTQAEKEYGLSI